MRKGSELYNSHCKHHGRTILYTNDHCCKQCAKEGASKRRKQNKDYNRPRELLNEIRNRARRKNIECNLTLDWMRREIEKVAVCPVLGIDIMHNVGMRSDNSISTDRIDSSGGYTLDNVCFLSDRANRIKSDGTTEEHIKLTIWMMRNVLHLTDGECLRLFNRFLDTPSPTKRNRAESNPQRDLKRVKQIDPNTGKVINIFDNCQVAAQEMNIDHSSVVKVASEYGYYKTAGGFKWEYEL